MYQFFLGNLYLPVAPDKVNITIGSQNKTITLVNGDEINILQSPKLKTIKFEALIPYKKYPFATYLYDFVDGDVYREEIEALKNNSTKFQFVITRERGLKVHHYTDIRATLEDVSITESTEYGYDIKMALTIKEYREFGAKLLTQTGSSNIARQQDNAPKSGTYTIIQGDSLWKIAKKYYGDGSRWKEIYNANTSIISNPNSIKIGTTITIP